MPGAAVYATPLGGPAPRGKLMRAAIEQREQEFVPLVTVLQTGTAVRFPNRDPVRHHVYSFSPPKTFEIKLYTGESPSEVIFDKPGVVTLGCNIHDWMLGHVLVVDTPYFTKTDGEGNARLADLPPGEYEVRAWHPFQKAEARPVVVNPATHAGRLEFSLEPVQPPRKYKPPLDRLKYN